MKTVFTGQGVTPLAGIGLTLWYDPTASLDLPPVSEAREPSTELERFETARAEVRTELAAERSRTREHVGDEEAEVFTAHIDFLTDPQITSGVTDAIEEERLPAEHAVHRAFGNAIDQFQSIEGVIAERADDLRDVRDRLLRRLLGVTHVDLGALPDETIVLTERLTPSDTVRLDPDRIAGFVTVEGGPTSHAAIMARALAIPAVVGVDAELEAVTDGTRALVDGEAGELVCSPDEERIARARRSRTVEVRSERVMTTDGRGIEVAANIGTPEEAANARNEGADGVGLFRTEFLFVDRETPPSEDEQFEAFVSVLDAFEGQRVIVRTLDIGGDKPLPYIDETGGENPFLGVRGVRLSPGTRPDLFETQMRALLRAAATEYGEGLGVMFPMVSTVEELESTLSAAREIADELDDAGVDHALPSFGVMIETPATTFTAEALAERVEFLSVGTNDLIQYVMAAARDDERVADLHQPLHPPVIRALAKTVEGGHAGDAWVGICGEMAGDPDLTELLVGLGFDELSMSLVTVPAVKGAIVETSHEEATALAERALQRTTREGVIDTLGLSRS